MEQVYLSWTSQPGLPLRPIQTSKRLTNLFKMGTRLSRILQQTKFLKLSPECQLPVLISWLLLCQVTSSLLISSRQYSAVYYPFSCSLCTCFQFTTLPFKSWKRRNRRQKKVCAWWAWQTHHTGSVGLPIIRWLTQLSVWLAGCVSASMWSNTVHLRISSSICGCLESPFLDKLSSFRLCFQGRNTLDWLPP